MKIIHTGIALMLITIAFSSCKSRIHPVVIEHPIDREMEDFKFTSPRQVKADLMQTTNESQLPSESPNAILDSKIKFSLHHKTKVKTNSISIFKAIHQIKKANSFKQPKSNTLEGSKKGLLMILVALLLIGLGYILYINLGVLGEILFLIFGIGGGIYLLFGLITLLFS